MQAPGSEKGILSGGRIKLALESSHPARTHVQHGNPRIAHGGRVGGRSDGRSGKESNAKLSHARLGEKADMAGQGTTWRRKEDDG